MRQIQEEISQLSSYSNSSEEKISRAFQKLENGLSQVNATAFQHWLEDRKNVAQGISYILYNCGKLAKLSGLALSAHAVNKLLDSVYYKKAH